LDGNVFVVVGLAGGVVVAVGADGVVLLAVKGGLFDGLTGTSTWVVTTTVLVDGTLLGALDLPLPQLTATKSRMRMMTPMAIHVLRESFTQSPWLNR
jgi:hypothetical protein